MNQVNSISEFVKLHCVGRGYDSCKNSPCRYSSSSGCTHPLHPKNQERECCCGETATHILEGGESFCDKCYEKYLEGSRQLFDFHCAIEEHYQNIGE